MATGHVLEAFDRQMLSFGQELVRVRGRERVHCLFFCSLGSWCRSRVEVRVERVIPGLGDITLLLALQGLGYGRIILDGPAEGLSFPSSSKRTS